MALSDWESDLTELESSSDEEYVPQPRKRGRPLGSVNSVKKEYKITDSLRPPRPANFSTKSLYDLLVAGGIDLDPQYQRDVVWPETKQAGLIDSMLRNFYIPPVIFACKRDPVTQNEVRICIDGKQRLTSIRRFFDGEIAHRDSTSGKKYWLKNTTNIKRPMLSPQLAQSFKLKQIVCVEYDDISEEQEREIFQRVQLGVALTPAGMELFLDIMHEVMDLHFVWLAERMQAISGPWPDLIRQIQSVIIGEEGFADALEWGSSRGRDFQCLAQVVYLLQGNSKIGHPSQVEKWLQNDKPVPPNLRSDIIETFKIFVHLARQKKYNNCFQKPARISPVEFIMTGVGIYNLRGRLSFTQLSSTIAKMREDVRARHVDVRANQRVVKDMQNFLKKVQPSALKTDPLDKTPAAVAIKSLGQSQKRKRGEDDSDDDEPRRPAASKVSKVSKAAKKGRVEPKPEPKASTSKAAAKVTTASGSKTTVKKVTTTVAKKVAASALSGSAMEPPAKKAALANPTPTRAIRQSTSASASTSTNTTPQPTPSSATSTSHSEPATTTEASSVEQATAARALRGSEETLSSSLSRRPAANNRIEQDVNSPEPSATLVQKAFVKADPDAPSLSGVLDRLAIIRKAKNSPDRGPPSGTILTPTQSSSLAVQQEQAIQQVASTSSPSALPISSSSGNTSSGSTLPQQSLLPSSPAPEPVPQPNTSNANETQSASSSTTAPIPQITAAQVQSILAKAGFSSQPPERRSTVDVLPASGADIATRDPRRRPSTSPNQTFYTPGFTSGTLNTETTGSLQPSSASEPSGTDAQRSAAGSPPADARRSPTVSTILPAPAPSAASPPLSPSLPKKPDVRLPLETRPSGMLAEQISPRRSPGIPKGPRADREREREWDRGGTYHGREGAKRTRWDN